ncbi:hypothetical protein B0H13DRAFT_2666592 [Mycena leptocephala]|nr:hypothetical protein B0H13DRAFT_2666592 [Mycena leptocephala]
MSDFKMLLSLLPPPPTFPSAPRARSLYHTSAKLARIISMPCLCRWRPQGGYCVRVASCPFDFSASYVLDSFYLELSAHNLSSAASFLLYSLAAASSITQGLGGLGLGRGYTVECRGEWRWRAG